MFNTNHRLVKLVDNTGHLKQTLIFLLFLTNMMAEPELDISKPKTGD